MKKRLPAPRAIAEPAKTPVTAIVEAMGAQGHGIARIGAGQIFIPFTLPGESVRVEIRGRSTIPVEIVRRSPERIEPVCRHFGACGGCALQHWKEPSYLAWKQALVTSALERAGINSPIEPIRSYPAPSRRRATFTARTASGKIAVGYNAARTHDVLDLDECPILLPQIALALPQLRAGLAAVMPASAEAKISVTAAVNGLDCAIQGPALPASRLAQLIAILGAAGFIRVTWNNEPALLAAAPFVSFGGVSVKLPPNTFLQAVEACERDMAAWALTALQGANAAAGPICDLFAGLGAFSFPAAKLAPVTAYEENALAIAELASAARQAKGLKPVSGVRRDLYRNPLSALELNKFGCVILDPPREGAEAQARALASSKVPAIAMLSCNPVSFARDAAILASGGFKLARLAAFDQFRFSAHVEIAALFQRPGSKKGGPSPALKQ